ncbi:MAG: hypothetical protein QOF87_3419, partial [Pseudonocardiales bacterium]|nr:hypothetical protein [Pseudonocardiales bacterium]
MPAISRRTLLVGGLGIAGVALVSKATLDRVDAPPAGVPDIEPGQLVSGSFTSPARLGARTGWTIAYPPNAPARLRVLV